MSINKHHGSLGTIPKLLLFDDANLDSACLTGAKLSADALRGAKSMESAGDKWVTVLSADGEERLEGKVVQEWLDHPPNNNHLPRKGDSWKAIEKEGKVIV